MSSYNDKVILFYNNEQKKINIPKDFSELQKMFYKEFNIDKNDIFYFYYYSQKKKQNIEKSSTTYKENFLNYIDELKIKKNPIITITKKPINYNNDIKVITIIDRVQNDILKNFDNKRKKLAKIKQSKIDYMNSIIKEDKTKEDDLLDIYLIMKEEELIKKKVLDASNYEKIKNSKQSQSVNVLENKNKSQNMEILKKDEIIKELNIQIEEFKKEKKLYEKQINDYKKCLNEKNKKNQEDMKNNEDLEKLKLQIAKELESNYEKILNQEKVKMSKEVNERIQLIQKKYEGQLEQIKKQKKINSKNKIVHQKIKCEHCFMEPIIGYRYKCVECQNYNLCESCEEKNCYDEQHPHDFIKMRKEKKDNISNIKLNNFMDNKINNNNFENDYSFECLTDLNEPKEVSEGWQYFKLEIKLRNNQKNKWPNSKTKLILDTKNSELKINDIFLNPQEFMETEKYTIEVVLGSLPPGKYKGAMQFEVDGKIFGDGIFFYIIIKAKDINTVNNIDDYYKLQKFRDEYALPKEDYPDDILFNSLKLNNFDTAKAFQNLFND